jgi:hypothetical protein
LEDLSKQYKMMIKFDFTNLFIPRLDSIASSIKEDFDKHPKNANL